MWATSPRTIGVDRGGGKGAMASPKCLENIAILCFERHFSKQDSAIRLKSNILPPPIFGLAKPLPRTLRPFNALADVLD